MKDWNEQKINEVGQAIEEGDVVVGEWPGPPGDGMVTMKLEVVRGYEDNDDGAWDGMIHVPKDDRPATVYGEITEATGFRSGDEGKMFEMDVDDIKEVEGKGSW